MLQYVGREARYSPTLPRPPDALTHARVIAFHSSTVSVLVISSGRYSEKNACVPATVSSSFAFAGVRLPASGILTEQSPMLSLSVSASFLCKVNSDIYGTGRIGLGEAVKVYEVKATTSYYVKGVPFDASLKIANKLMEAIEPFDYSEMVKFEKKYLQGFCADKYDQRPTEIMERFVKRLDRFSQENYKNIAGKYDTFEPRTQKNFTWMSDVNIKYCLMPVWFMTVEFDGRQYQFAVNGQTGEASGQAPTTSATDKLDSFARFARSNWKWLPVALAIVLPGFIYNSVSVSDYSPFYVFLVVAMVVLEIALIAFSIALFVAGHVADGVSKTIHKTADPANDFDKDPGLDRYLDTTRKVTFTSDEQFFRREGRQYADDEEEIETVGDLFRKRGRF